MLNTLSRRRLLCTLAGSPAALELYDHRTDPHEAHNLAESPAHAHVRKQMSMLLAKARPASSPHNSQ